MKQVILDTSFILSCVRQKIDFFEIIENKGLEILIPEQTIKELKGLNANLALKIIEGNEFNRVNVPGKDADAAIIKFSEKYPEVIVATLDSGLKKKIKSQKMVIRGKKKIEII